MATSIEQAFADQRARGRCQFFRDGAWCQSERVADYRVRSAYGRDGVMQLCTTHAGRIAQNRAVFALPKGHEHSSTPCPVCNQDVDGPALTREGRAVRWDTQAQDFVYIDGE